MKIALAQLEVTPGRPDKNVNRMLQMIDDAKAQKADLVVFPEMAVGGYLLGDKWLEDAYCKDLMEYNDILREASENIAIAYGNVFVDDKISERVGEEGYHPNEDGRSRKYNAIYIFQNGEPVQRLKETNILPLGVQPKTLLPNYRFFDDKRYFHSTREIAQDFGVNLESLLSPFVINIRGKNVPAGFELCEDLWCEDYRKGMKSLNPTKILTENGAELIVNVSSSPWTYGKNSARDRRVQFLKKESGDSFVPFYYVNCVGAQNNGKNIVTFDGGSTVYNCDGLPVVLNEDAYEQALIVVGESDLEKTVQERNEESMIAQKFKAIIRGINHVQDITGSDSKPRYIIGLSGGIDSSVVAGLLVQAVGPGRVIGINMPSRYNSAKTKDAARRVAESLGIGYEIIPVEELTKLNQQLIDSVDIDGSGRGLDVRHMENVQAKLRGTAILSNVAAKYNAIFTNNGNKLEVALGYSTLYGDWGGALAPIADLTKTEVVAMARYLNEEIYKREVIPEKVIPDELWKFRDDQIQPSAELKDNQVDPMKFGYHCALIEAMTDFKKKSPEDIMEWYLKGTLAQNLRISNELLSRWNIYDPQEFVKDLEWFSSTIQANVFKRVQAPPIIITSKSAYGYDIRESMVPYIPTKRYGELRKKVLEMKAYVPGGNHE